MSRIKNLVTRRDFIYSSLLTTGGLTLAPTMPAWGASGTAKTWSPDTRDAAIASEEWLNGAFMAANPGATIDHLNVPYGDDTAKLVTGHAAGDVPDLTWVYSDFLFTFGLEGIASNMNNTVAAIGRDRFMDGAMNGIQVGGNYYSVPFVGFPFFIYYRKDIYEKLGLNPPTTHEEFLHNIEACHNPPEIYGYQLTNQAISDVWNLKTAMWTHGAYFFDENDNLALDRPETIDAWNFYKELGKWSPPGSMAQSELETRALYVDGKCAHMMTTTSMSANFTPDNIGRFGAAVYPSKPGALGASLDFYGFVIPTKAKNPELAEELIKYWLSYDVFQEYLARTVVGWVPMMSDAYSDAYLNHPRISIVRDFIDIGGKAAANGVVGTGYFGPSKHAGALTATDVEKQIGDRLVVLDQKPEDVLKWAIDVIKSEM